MASKGSVKKVKTDKAIEAAAEPSADNPKRKSTRKPGTSDRTRRRKTPPELRRPRGRPRLEPTPELRAKVKMLIGSGMTTEEVALVVGCTKMTLYNRFSPEIAHGRVLMKAEALELVWKHARDGSSPMIRKVVDLTSVPQNREAFQGAADAEEARQEKKIVAKKLGKKEQQALAAANPDVTDELGAMMAARANRSLN